MAAEAGTSLVLAQRPFDSALAELPARVVAIDDEDAFADSRTTGCRAAWGRTGLRT